MRRVVESYIEGLHWVLEYYYRGVASWGWCYPYHYSPMVSDLTGLQGFSPHFDRGAPFTPYQQLLAVLPAASAKLLPKPYQVSLPSCISFSCSALAPRDNHLPMEETLHPQASIHLCYPLLESGPHDSKCHKGRLLCCTGYGQEMPRGAASC